MQFGFARVFQKTNSFSRRMTSADDFRGHEWVEGLAIREFWTGTNTAASGVLGHKGTPGVDIAPVLSTSARAGGPVSVKCLNLLARQVVASFESSSPDMEGIILELSGTLILESASSGDEFLVDQISSAFPDVPIVLTVSAQASLTENLVNQCAAIISPLSVPAVDGQEQGQHAVDVLARICQDTREFTTVFQRLPLLIPVAAQRSDRKPMDEITGSIEAASEHDEVVSVSLLCGYPFADAPHSGASVVVTSSADAQHTRALAQELSETVWRYREEFFVDGSNVEEAVHHAMATREGPVVIADLGDNPDDGAPGDGTTALWALLDLGVRNATIGALVDEQAVEACIRAGVGARVEIPVGGRRDTRHGYPIDISGNVVSIHDGPFRLNGPVNSGVQVDVGSIIVLNVDARHDGHVELIMTENPIQITDTSLFEHVGIDLATRQIISIKSVNDYRPAFEPIAREIFEIITPGITTPDPAFFAYQHVSRPIFPLDPVEE